MKNNKLKKGCRRVLIAGTLVSLLSGSSILSGPYIGDKVANFLVHPWDTTVKGLECEIYKGKHIHGDEKFIEDIINALKKLEGNKFYQIAMNFNTLRQSDEYKCLTPLGISYVHGSDMGLAVAMHAIDYINDYIKDYIKKGGSLESAEQKGLESVKQKGLQSLLVHLGIFRKTYKENLSKQDSIKGKLIHFYYFKNKKEDGFAAQKKFLDSKGIKLTPCSLTCWVSRNYQNEL